MTWYLKKQGTVRVVVARPVSPACVARREDMVTSSMIHEVEKTGQEAVHKGC